jgi:GPH family glycoside/pentoside/hexuronide:cation symporter
MASNERLSFTEKLAYGLGDTASNFFYQFFNLFLTYYYTDIFGLAPLAVGTMMLVLRLFDAVVDPVVGIAADRTNTRWGKFRPYLLWGAIPYGIIGYVMFLNPSLSAHGKLVYAYATYGLFWVAYAALNIPYSALMGVMSSSSEQRTSLSTYRFVCAFAGGYLISLLVIPLKKLLGHGSEAEGIRYTMMIFAVASILLFFFTFAKTRERVVQPAGQENAFGKDLGNMARNGPWLALFFSGLFTLINTAIGGGSVIYYFKYVAHDETKFTLYSTLGFLAFMAGAACTKLFLKLGDRRTLMIVLSFINAAVMASYYFVNPASYKLLIGLKMFATFIVGPTPAILWSMYADTADYGEWRFGRRTTGLVFSALVFSQKVGLAVGTGALGWLLNGFGFVANVDQGHASIMGINLMFSIIPAVTGFLGGVAILFYKITDPMMKDIERDLTERRSAAA